MIKSKGYVAICCNENEKFEFFLEDRLYQSFKEVIGAIKYFKERDKKTK